MHDLLIVAAASVPIVLAAFSLGRALAPHIGHVSAFACTVAVLWLAVALLPWQVWAPGFMLLILGRPALSKRLERRAGIRREETRRTIRDLERYADDATHDFPARVAARNTAFDLRRQSGDWIDWP